MSLFFYFVGNTEDKIKYILTAYLLNAKKNPTQSYWGSYVCIFDEQYKNGNKKRPSVQAKFFEYVAQWSLTQKALIIHIYNRKQKNFFIHSFMHTTLNLYRQKNLHRASFIGLSLYTLTKIDQRIIERTDRVRAFCLLFAESIISPLFARRMFAPARVYTQTREYFNIIQQQRSRRWLLQQKYFATVTVHVSVSPYRLSLKLIRISNNR